MKQAYPGELDFWAEFVKRMVEACALAGRTPDLGLSIFLSRAGYSIGDGMPPAQAMDRHLRELRAYLGVPLDGTAPVVEASDQEKVELAAALMKRPTWDVGGLVDIGFRYGTMLQAGYSRRDALRACGAWMVQWYGGANPWGHPDPIIGRLRIEQGAYVDDTGPVLPTFCHAGDLYALFVRDQATALGELDDMAEAGYHGLRFWTTLGGDYWDRKDRGVRAEGTWPQFEAFLRALRERSLCAVVSQGDVGLIENRREFMHRLAEVANAVDPAVVAFVDMGNEAWQTGEADPEKLAEMARWYREADGPGIVSLTSPRTEERSALAAYSIDPAQVYDVHSYRDGHWYDKTRHIFSTGYEDPPRRLGIQSEPAGPGELVSVTQNKHELDMETLALMAAASLASRQAWVYFCGDGVSRRAPIKSNPGYASVAAMRRHLPRDLMRFETLTHGGKNKRGERVLGVTNDDMRADQAISSDGRVVAICHGPSPRPFEVDKAFVGHVIDPGTGEAYEVAPKSGEQLQMDFARGRVVSGRLL